MGCRWSIYILGEIYWRLVGLKSSCLRAISHWLMQCDSRLLIWTSISMFCHELCCLLQICNWLFSLPGQAIPWPTCPSCWDSSRGLSYTDSSMRCDSRLLIWTSISMFCHELCCLLQICNWLFSLPGQAIPWPTCPSCWDSSWALSCTASGCPSGSTAWSSQCHTAMPNRQKKREITKAAKYKAYFSK